MIVGIETYGGGSGSTCGNIVGRLVSTTITVTGTGKDIRDGEGELCLGAMLKLLFVSGLGYLTGYSDESESV